MGAFDEKNRSQKSRASVPLRSKEILPCIMYMAQISSTLCVGSFFHIVFLTDTQEHFVCLSLVYGYIPRVHEQILWKYFHGCSIYLFPIMQAGPRIIADDEGPSMVF